MLKELMFPAEVKLLKPNPAGCWHCVPAMMHGLAALCGPSTLPRNGVPAPGKSVSVTAEAAPVRAKVTAVAPIPIHAMEFLPLDAATEPKMPPEMLQKGITNAPARGIPVKHPLMHRTRSLDYAIILSGEIDMMLDDGDVHLKPGDVIVQQATNHAWVNRGKEPCRILFVLMD